MRSKVQSRGSSLIDAAEPNFPSAQGNVLKFDGKIPEPWSLE
jgi:hypothetical protein